MDNISIFLQNITNFSYKLENINENLTKHVNIFFKWPNDK